MFPSRIPLLLARSPWDLDLDFAKQQYSLLGNSGAFSSFVAFTRASSATKYGPSGLLETVPTNIPCFSYDRATLKSLGLQAEEARTNLQTRSQTYASWRTATLYGTLSPTADYGLDGTLTAARMTEDTTATAGRYALGPATMSFTAGTQYVVWSVFKAGVGGATRYPGFVMQPAAFGSLVACAYDLSGAGSYNISSTGTNTSAGIIALGNGWYLCWLSSQATASATTDIQYRMSNTSAAAASYTGDGVSNLVMWGGGVETGFFPTSYIPTAAAAVTRAAVVTSMPATLGTSRGIVVSGRTAMGPGTQTILSLDDGTADERIHIQRQSDRTLHAIVVDGGVTQCDLNLGAVADQTDFRLALSVAANDFRASLLGGAVVSDTAGTLPTITTRRFGHNYAGLNHWNSTISRVIETGSPLSNSALMRLSLP